LNRRRLLWLLVLSACAACAAVELVLHVWVLPRYWRPLPPFGAQLTPVHAQWLERQKEELAGRVPLDPVGTFDAELGWDNLPGSRGEYYSVHPGGWRGSRDYAPVAPEGVTRLAAFGESFTFGHEVRDHETWEVQLEALDPRLEVPNYGVGAYGTDQALLRAERVLPRADADIVLVGLMLENIGRNVNRYRPCWVPTSYAPVAKPRFVLEDGALRLIPLPFRDRAEYVEAVESGTVLERLREHEYWIDAPLSPLLAWSACARLFHARRAYHARYTVELWKRRDEPLLVTLALLERFRALARENGARDAVVLIFPARTDLVQLLDDGEKYWSVLMEELERRGAPYLDLSDALRAEAEASGPAALYVVGHYSREGNAVVAHALQEWLAGWL
jgi:hypothetical protein